MKKFAILAFAGMSAFALPAFAAESEFTIGAQRLTLDADGFESVEVDGVYMSYENSYDNGLELNTRAFFGEFDSDLVDEELLTSDIDASWKWRGLVGPKFMYSAISTTTERESVSLAGVTFERDFGSLNLTGDVLSDIHEFGDETLVLAGAEYGLGRSVVPEAEYGRLFNGTEAETGSLGVKYNFDNGSFISAKAGKTSLFDGASAKTAFIGGGLNF